MIVSTQVNVPTPVAFVSWHSDIAVLGVLMRKHTVRKHSSVNYAEKDSTINAFWKNIWKPIRRMCPFCAYGVARVLRMSIIVNCMIYHICSLVRRWWDQVGRMFVRLVVRNSSTTADYAFTHACMTMHDHFVVSRAISVSRPWARWRVTNDATITIDRTNVQRAVKRSGVRRTTTSIGGSILVINHINARYVEAASRSPVVWCIIFVPIQAPDLINVKSVVRVTPPVVVITDTNARITTRVWRVRSADRHWRTETVSRFMYGYTTRRTWCPDATNVPLQIKLCYHRLWLVEGQRMEMCQISGSTIVCCAGGILVRRADSMHTWVDMMRKVL